MKFSPVTTGTSAPKPALGWGGSGKKTAPAATPVICTIDHQIAQGGNTATIQELQKFNHLIKIKSIEMNQHPSKQGLNSSGT
jgi:hypothetical protein